MLDETDFLRIGNLIRNESDYLSSKIHKSIADSFVNKLDYLKDQEPLRTKIFGIYASVGILGLIIAIFEILKK